MKESKIASLVYYIVLGLSAVVFVLFFCVGFGDMDMAISAKNNSPRYTDLLLILMYALVGVTAIATIVALAMTKPSAIESNVSKGGKIVAVVMTWIFVPVLLLSYFLLGDATPILKASGEVLQDSVFWLKITDAFIYTIYVLMVVTVLCLVYGLTGFSKRK